MSHYVTINQYVDIDIDLEEILDDVDDETLAEAGYKRLSAKPAQNGGGVFAPPADSLEEHLWACANAKRSK